jgi:hypothetical protein
MPKFHFVFLLEPAGIFGLPEEAMTVVPPGIEVDGPWIHGPTHAIVTHGTLPQYRRPEEAVNEQFQIGSFTFKLEDNFLSTEGEAEHPEPITSEVFKTVHLITLALQLRHGGSQINYKLVLARDGKDKKILIPPPVKMLAARTYDLHKLKEAVRQIPRDIERLDDRIKRALVYFDAALFMERIHSSFAMISEKDRNFLIPEIFLNYYKAICAVVGDPTRDSDYQRRCEDLGFDASYRRNKIESIREIRNNYDVAHYDLVGKAEEVKKTIANIKATATEVVLRAIEAQK